MISLQYYAGPVTALEIIDDYILAGIGDHLHIFSAESKQEIQVVRSIPNRNIHGIKADSAVKEQRLVCIYGAKSIRVVQCEQTEKCRCSLITEMIELMDWIQDIQWLTVQSSDVSQIAIAMSHNIVVLWDWNRNTILKQMCCEEQCILYSALFIGYTWKDLLLAAGTVFNQVVVWAVNGETDNERRCKVIHRLTGHQGVIFGIDYHSGRQEICTVSDDRSIQIWKLTFPDSDVDMSTIEKWTKCQMSLVRSLYGHAARVWKGRILSRRLLSIGEDSTCCIWNEDGRILKKFKGHKANLVNLLGGGFTDSEYQSNPSQELQGKSIWSLAVNKEETFMVTGGGDCSIRMWSISEMNTATVNSTSQKNFTIPESMTVDSDFPRIVCLQNFDTMFVMTNEGKLFECHIKDENWKCLMDDKEFRSYSILSVCESGKFVAVGNINGGLIIFVTDENNKGHGDTIRIQRKIYDGKVFSINWLDDTSLVTTGPDGLIILWRLDAEKRFEDRWLDKVCDFHLPTCKQRWLSAATYTADRECIVCGDRGGTVHLYTIPEREMQLSRDPIQSFPKIHGKAGVTDACILGDRVYTAGRDGQFREYIYNDLRLELLNSNKVLKGLEWIGRIKFVEDDLLIFGFQSSNFVMWSTNQNQKLLEVECGGGHRAWDNKMKDGRSRFVYLKTGSIVMCETAVSSNQTILKTGLHGREMCDTKFLGSVLLQDQTIYLLLTCSEDTTINLCAVGSCGLDSLDLKVLKTFASHIGSVRTIAPCLVPRKSDGPQTTLVFSAGGRAQMKVWRITYQERKDKKEATGNTLNNISSICDNLLTITHEQLGSFMLGERRKSSKPWKTGAINANPETRFMDIAVFCATDIYSDMKFNGIYFVATACSDGFVRLFVFLEQSNQLTLIGLSEFHDHCVLKVKHIIHRNGDTCRVVLLSAATDGILAFWDVTELCDKYTTFYLNSPTYGEHGDFSERQHPNQNSENSKASSNLSFVCEQGGQKIHTSDSLFGVTCQPAEIKTLNSSEDVNFVHYGDNSEYVKDSEHSKADNSSASAYSFQHLDPMKFANNSLFSESKMVSNSICNETTTSDVTNLNVGYNNYSSNQLTSSQQNFSQQRSYSRCRNLCHGTKDVFISSTNNDSDGRSVEMFPLYTVQSHQSGINSVHIMCLSDNKYMVASGGDDGALHVLILRITHDGIVVDNQGSKLDAHSAQITGIGIVNRNEILTASIDQRICIWSVTVLSDEIEITMKCCRFVNVADISGIDCLLDRGCQMLAVCGVGLGILEIS